MRYELKGLNELPTEILHIPDFISIVGEAVSDWDNAADMDILVRGSRELDEGVIPLLEKNLERVRQGKNLHFIFNPTGPHKDFVPLYHLYLVRSDKFELKQVLESQLPLGVADWVAEQLENRELKLDLGCGHSKPEGFFGIDRKLHPGVDMILDFSYESLPFPESSLAVVRAYHVLEHLSNASACSLIAEVWRVLKSEGKFDVEVPSTEGAGAFMPDHYSYWNELSFSFFIEDALRDQIKTPAKFRISKAVKSENRELGTVDLNVVMQAVK